MWSPRLYWACAAVPHLRQRGYCLVYEQTKTKAVLKRLRFGIIGEIQNEQLPPPLRARFEQFQGNAMF